MIFHNPEAFFLFIPLMLILIYLWFFSNQKKPALQWSSIALFQGIAPSLRVMFKWVPFALQIVSIFLLITALARPQKLDTMINKSMEGIDIMMVLDISFSMEVEDMKPGTRLASAKNVIRKFIEGLSSDRVGLILFSGESYTKVPLTLDYQMLKKEVSQVETSPDIQMGTAIGVALANASARLRHSQAKSRIVILLTDGENNRGNISPETALIIAKKMNIKIYTIGLGSQTRSKVPIKHKDISGRTRTSYAVINSKMNTKLLSKLAHETSGKFYLAKNLKTLDRVFDEIGNLEKSKIEVKKWTQRQELFQKFLKWTVALYSMSLLLSITVFGRVF